MATTATTDIARRSSQGEAPAEILRNLAAHCHDGVHGYLRAAEDTSDRYLVSEFEELADERHRMAEELDSTLRKMGESIPSGGTPVGRLHRLWLDLAAVVSHGDRTRILRQVLRGETALEQAYDDALRADLSPEIREIVKRQHRSVRRVRNQFRERLDTTDSSGPVAERVNQFTQPIWEHPFVAAAAGVAIAMIVGGAILRNDSRDRRR